MVKSNLKTAFYMLWFLFESCFFFFVLSPPHTANTFRLTCTYSIHLPTNTHAHPHRLFVACGFAVRGIWLFSLYSCIDPEQHIHTYTPTQLHTHTNTHTGLKTEMESSNFHRAHKVSPSLWTQSPLFLSRSYTHLQNPHQYRIDEHAHI